jgi:flagellar biosynthesis protein FlhB
MIFPWLKTQEDRMKYEIRRLSFAETFGEAFKLYFDNFSPLFLIALISSIPAILVPQQIDVNAANGKLPDTQQAVVMLDVFLWFVILIAIHILSTALMIQYIYRKYLKQHQTVNQYIRSLLPFILPIMVLSIVAAVIVGAGLLAFLFPAIYFTLALSMSSQALIVEGKRVFESIQRSFDLTKGYKLEIFSYLLVLSLINLAVIFINSQFLQILDNMEVAAAAQKLIAHLVIVLMAPLNACLFILIYFNLRIEKEGFTLEHLENQFPS